jgi:hypothetical protein
MLTEQAKRREIQAYITAKHKLKTEEIMEGLHDLREMAKDRMVELNYCIADMVGFQKALDERRQKEKEMGVKILPSIQGKVIFPNEV